MKKAERLQCLEVWGDLAGFFPPDAKVERYTYPIITPSAARNIFRAIYSNPYEFEWIVHHIAMLNPPEYISITTNELQTAQSMDGGGKYTKRTQRTGIYLKNPRYRIWASLRMWDDDPVRQRKYESIFIDRACSGQYRHRPYLGLRELVACFRYIPIDSSLDFRPVDFNADLGMMVYDPWDLRVRPVVREDGKIDREKTAELSAPGRFATFPAVVSQGWLTTPDLLGSAPPRLPLPEEVYANL